MINNSRTSLLGVKIDNISKNALLEVIKDLITSNQKSIISYANLHSLKLCSEIPWFRNFQNHSQIVYCDGVGVQIGAWLTNQKHDYRFTLPDWINCLCHSALNNSWGLFFLGAKPGVSELAAKKLLNIFPELKIRTYHGFFNKVGQENKDVLEMIDQSSAQILLVGMGMPMQEEWIDNNSMHLNKVIIILPVGALFDYVAGVIPRGPRILTNHGFEWLTRLFVEPARLWQRYVIGIPVVLFRIIRHYFKFGNEII